jgi:hypothetical protein
MAIRAKFETLPDWTIDPDHQDGAALASALRLAGLTEKWVRLTAETQRKVLGYPVFGKRAIYASAGDVRIVRSVCFGLDFDCITLPWSRVTDYAKEKRRPE